MTNTAQNTLMNAVLIILGAYAAISGVVKAKGFLMPITVAGLLAMLLLPLSYMFERWRMGRTLATFISITFLLALAIGLNFLLIKQVQSFSQSLPQMMDELQPRLERLNDYISEQTGVSPWKQRQQLKTIIQERMLNIGSSALGLISDVQHFLQTTLLIFVYTFFFILYRDRFLGFILLLIPEEKRSEVQEIIRSSSKIAQEYILGRIILIVFLALIYYAGFSAVSLKHTLFLSGLVAVLSVIPYLGNIIGLLFALGVGLLTGMGLGQLLGLIIIFSVAQVIESYILEPYIVGHRVELNAVMTIIAIVLGGAVWGVIGIIIALPVIGIAKVICDHVQPLHPFGYLLGGEGGFTMDSIRTFKNKVKTIISSH